MPSLRRRGFAAQLLRDVLERLVDEGFSTVFLFADVDPRIYESVGFQALPERFQQREGSTLMWWGPGAEAVMSGISEALVATAVGLMVALPAVMMFNYLQRPVRGAVSEADALAHDLLAELRGETPSSPQKGA